MIGCSCCKFSFRRNREFLELIKAIQYNNTAKVEELVNRDSVNVNKKKNKATPLIVAISYKRVKLVKILLEAGADLEFDFKGFTPLTFAVSMEETPLEIVEILLRAGALIENAMPDGMSPLDFTLENGKYDVAKLLKNFMK